MARSSPTDLTLDPLLVAALLLLMALIALRGRDARRRVETIGVWRMLALATSLTLIGVALVSPVATVASTYLLTAHLVQITLLMGFAPPLLLLGLPRAATRPRMPRILGRLRDLAVHPLSALVMVNGVFFGWHAPPVYGACLDHPVLYDLQMLTLLGASVAFWWPIVIPAGQGKEGLSPLGKLGYILLATIPQTFAGMLLALAHAPFYAAYAAAPRVLGLGAMTDQQVAGACTAIISKLALFAAFSVVMWRLLDARGATEDDATDDHGGNGGQGDDDAPRRPVTPPAPAWLGLLDRSPMPDEPAPVRAARRETMPAAR